MDKNRKVAIVGSGISGAATAWALRDQADVALFEADLRFGGHTHTVQVTEPDQTVEVDTGFMVFNRPNYPLLSALFKELEVETYPTDMSFSASFDGGRLEYSGTDVNGLFAQRSNLVRPSFLRMLADVARFNRAAAAAARHGLPEGVTLERFLDRHRLGRIFRTQYLYPMAAAIWSCPDGQIARFPAASFLKFFSNHGLIQLADRPQWETVRGGASVYMRRLMEALGKRAFRGNAVERVIRNDEHVDIVMADGHRERFDDVVLACHSDQALALLDKPSDLERRVLEAIPYQHNRVLLHRDDRLMPVRRRVWSSWNYLARSDAQRQQSVSVTYWMNSLQDLGSDRNYFVSLNPITEPDERKVVAELSYEHPVFGSDALEAQRQLADIQGTARTWFAGAWTGYGFHEDGIRSAVNVVEALGAEVPWSQARQASMRLAEPAQRRAA